MTTAHHRRCRPCRRHGLLHIIINVAILLSWFSSVDLATGVPFKVNGPVLTITLKDPEETGGGTTRTMTSSASSTPSTPSSASSSSTPSSSSASEGGNGKWLDIGSLHPHAIWSIQSRGPPFPRWFPVWKALRGSLSYRYRDSPLLPSSVEAQALFVGDRIGDLQIQPSHHFRSKRSTVLVQATRGNSVSCLAQISTTGGGGGGGSGRGGAAAGAAGSIRSSSSSFPPFPRLDFLRANIRLDLPFTNLLSAVKLSPSFDFRRNQPSCAMEGITSSGRTKAILQLQWQEPTLTVVHALDDRNTIAPEISLQTAKIRYNWHVELRSGGSVDTTVDPTSAIHITWTDRSYGGGRWVTDMRLPLRGTTLHDLAAHLRVRRQFVF